MESSEELLSDMIVLGLSWKAKDEDIHEYFSRFGELDFYEVCSSYLIEVANECACLFVVVF